MITRSERNLLARIEELKEEVRLLTIAARLLQKQLETEQK